MYILLHDLLLTQQLKQHVQVYSVKYSRQYQAPSIT